jgi:hypothetical protein
MRVQCAGEQKCESCKSAHRFALSEHCGVSVNGPF